LLLESIKLKFNYGLSKQFPVSLFVKLAMPESSYKEIHDISSLYDTIKKTQTDIGCYHVVLYDNLDRLENVEEIIWVFSKLLESMRCSLSVIIQSEAELKLFGNNLFSANYVYILSDRLSITKNYWKDINILEEDLLIFDVNGIKDLKALREYILNKGIKARLGFNVSSISSFEVTDWGIVDLIPVPLNLIL
jgi:hypothetical protein